MPRKVSVTNLNASTIDILNVIRNNASLEYQSLVPEVMKASDIPTVGSVIYGYPALANQFINALVNRIALVRVKSATFNNRFANLKKGYLEFGETIEEVFVQIASVRVFNVEKAPERELKRTLPIVLSAFHAMNWKVQYPITVQDEDLKQAFLSVDGVQDLITRIVDSVYTAAEYDEYLLFKYLLIKSIAKGQMKPVSIGTEPLESAEAFRSTSNLFTFMKKDYNASNVLTTTPKERQRIFMDASFNAKFDVQVLASAFHMDKADFMGRLELIDDWTTFDNERWEVIRSESDMVEEVTEEELALLADVKAVLVDEDFFQVYDNNFKFTEKYVSSGMYWNYFLNSWKTVSTSPFSNAVVFVSGEIETPGSITVEVQDKSIGESGTVLTVVPQVDGANLVGGQYQFVQTKALTQAGVAIHPYGAVIIPKDNSTEVTLEMKVSGHTYKADSSISSAQEVGNTVTMSPVDELSTKAKTRKSSK